MEFCAGALILAYNRYANFSRTFCHVNVIKSVWNTVSSFHEEFFLFGYQAKRFIIGKKNTSNLMWQSKIYKSISGLAEFSLFTPEVFSLAIFKSSLPSGLYLCAFSITSKCTSLQVLFNSIHCSERSYCYLGLFFIFRPTSIANAFQGKSSAKGKNPLWTGNTDLKAWSIMEDHFKKVMIFWNEKK